MARKKQLRDKNSGEKTFIKRDENGRFSERATPAGRALAQRVSDATERVIRNNRPALEYLRDK